MNTHIKTFEQLTTKQLFYIYKLRVDTFVVEQHCPYHEIDDIDLKKPSHLLTTRKRHPSILQTIQTK